MFCVLMQSSREAQARLQISNSKSPKAKDAASHPLGLHEWPVMPLRRKIIICPNCFLISKWELVSV